MIYWTDDVEAVEQASDWLCYTVHYLVIVAYMMVARMNGWIISYYRKPLLVGRLCELNYILLDPC